MNIITFIKELTEAILAIIGLFSLLTPFLKKVIIPVWFYCIKIIYPYKKRLKKRYQDIIKTQGIGIARCTHCNSRNIRLNTSERIPESGTLPNFMQYWCYNCQKPFDISIKNIFKMYDGKWLKHSEYLSKKTSNTNNKVEINS